MPSVLAAVETCVRAGAHGITVHPRADARHITSADVRDIAGFLTGVEHRVEYNIEGDPRPDLLELVHQRHAGSVHAGSRAAGRDHQSGWLVGRQPRPRPSSRRWCGNCVTRVCVSACSSMPMTRRFVGRRILARIGSSCTGAVRACLQVQGERRLRRSFAAYVKAAELAHSWALASTRVTTSISTTS